ncbi:hypothetical protein GRF29_103g1644743 [Pseudopithomyces chartarum]|uniref:Microbial-type PARG catalytic domain-containing protein n=1 Tax=Pseudopithomyces chartarum TaxID=1892770 RepID=A0AAN6REW5_9PLEO|nr:hypothetical protein GRF29_103g1644743 [Pseudopithomyces chartarum]
MTPPNPNPRPKVVIPKLELPPPAHATESDMTSSNSNQNAEDATSTSESTPALQATTSSMNSSSSNEEAGHVIPTLEPAPVPQNVTSEPSPTPQNVTSQPAQSSSSAPTLSRATLGRIARENIICLPQIVDKVPRLDIDSSEAVVYAEDPFRALPHVRMPDQSKCPKFEALSPACGTRILVEDIALQDSVEAAIVIAGIEGRNWQNSDTSISEQTIFRGDIASRLNPNLEKGLKTPVLILNCACDESPGGNWIGGGKGQEEALFYRTSLSRSLRQKHYPLISDSAIYSPKVFVMRKSADEIYAPLFGKNVASLREEDPHNPNDRSSTPQDPSTLGLDPKTFQVFSVVSISPVRNPALSDRRYVSMADMSAILERMRIVLRIAASHGHTRLVLAAFGCGRANHPLSWWQGCG